MIEDFLNYVEDGCIMDDDGEGIFLDRYGNEMKNDPGYIRCDPDWINKNKRDYPYIKWFNK